ncbi:MAG: asparagine synthase-related protein [Candidatus Nanoarchaeia archaeon]|nr:asparagine synthase-related protein [Candidatus Nanoarchaeia archaeon]
MPNSFGQSGKESKQTLSDGDFSISFNGHIHKFESPLNGGSDIEKILRGYITYGAEVVEKLIGEFVFSIEDNKNNKIVVGRDRLGGKSQYYSHSDGTIKFSSEIRDFQFPKCLNITIPNSFIEFETTLEDETLFEKSKALMPGHVLSYYVDEDRVEIKKYWDFPINVPMFKGKDEDLILELEDRVMQAIETRMPKEPYAILLSGGLDSSTLGFLASKIKKPDAFIISHFPGMPVQFDEYEFANMVSKKLQVPLIKVVPTAQDFKEKMPKALALFDRPLASAAILPIYMIAEELQKNGIENVFTGSGPDEFLNGYARHKIMARSLEDLEKFIENPKLLETEWPTMVSYLPLMIYFMEGKKDKKLDFTQKADRYYHLIRRGNSGSTAPLEFVRDLFSHVENNDTLRQVSYTDAKVSFPPLLQLEEKTFGAFGISGYTPFLDQAVLEMAFGLPPHLKITDEYRSKHILRVIAERAGVPLEITNRKDKVGFATPFNYWFDNELKDWKEKLLQHAGAELLTKTSGVPSRGKYDRDIYQRINMILWMDSISQ